MRRHATGSTWPDRQIPARFDFKKLDNLSGRHIAGTTMLHCCKNCRRFWRHRQTL